MDEILEQNASKELDTAAIVKIFDCSRPTAYNIMDGRSEIVTGTRKRRVITVGDLLKIIQENEEKLNAELREKVTEPRDRLLNILEISS